MSNYGIMFPTLTQSKYYLKNLLNNMRYGDVKKVIESSNKMAIEMKNGDIYKAISTGEQSRGDKFNKIYTKRNMNSIALKSIINDCSPEIVWCE